MFPLHALMKQGHSVPNYLSVLEDLLTSCDVNAKDAMGQTPLHCLFQNPRLLRDFNVFNRLLSEGADVNVIDMFGYTPLHRLMQHGHAIPDCLAILTILLIFKSDVNAKNMNGDTPLHYLFENQNLLRDFKFLDAFLSAGAKADLFDRYGCTPLHRLMQHGHLIPCFSDILKAILVLKYDVNAKNHNGYTPVHYFFENQILLKNVDVLNALLSAGADVHICDRNGCTPLHLLIRYRHSIPDCLVILDILLTLKSDVNAKNDFGNTPLQSMFRTEILSNDVNVFNALVSAGAEVNTCDKYGRSPLHYLLQHTQSIPDCLAILKILLNFTFDVNVKSQNGYTALHCLFKNKNLLMDINIFTALISAGADVNAGDKYGNTPLHDLIQNGNSIPNCLAILKTMLNRTSNINANNNDRCTPLFCLFKNKDLLKDINIFNALISAGAGVNTRDNSGCILLHYLMEHGHLIPDRLTILKTLLSLASDVNVKNKKGCTPLLCLFRNHHLLRDVNVFNALISAGADVNACDKNGNTPLHYLMKYGHLVPDCLAVLKGLLNSMADVNLKNQLGETPFHFLFENKILMKDINVFHSLISAGIDVNILDRYGNTKLHSLMQHGHFVVDCLNILNTLVAHKTDVNVKNRNGDYPLHCLFQNLRLIKNTNVFNALISAGANVNAFDKCGCTPLHCLMRNGHLISNCLEILNILLTHRADVTAKNLNGLTPLQCLFENPNLIKNVDVFKLLATASSGTNSCDKYGNTPLHYLMQYGHSIPDYLDVLYALFSPNMCVNAKNRNGDTPLHCLFQNQILMKDINVFDALISAGANVNMYDRYGFTPLHRLMQYGHSIPDHLAILKTLLNLTSDVNSKNLYGDTPLLCLFQSQNLMKDMNAFNALISAGADVNTFNKYGYTPLHRLMQHGHWIPDRLVILKTLLTLGSDVKVKDKNGRVPLLYMFENENLFTDFNMLFVLIAEGADVNKIPINTLLKRSDETRDEIIKLIIKCEVLKFEKFFSDNISEKTLISRFMKLGLFKKISKRRRWCRSYVTKCVSELLEMIKQPFEGNYTLSEHLFNFFEKRQLKSFPSEMIINNVLDFISRGSYPCYENIIKLSIHPYDISDQLTLAVKSGADELILNSYCVHAVAKFLSKKELLYLTTVCASEK